MTVQELRDFLATLPGDEPVFVAEPLEGYQLNNPSCHKVCSIRYEPICEHDDGTMFVVETDLILKDCILLR